MLADRGLTDLQTCRRLGEAQRLGHGKKRSQLFWLVHRVGCLSATTRYHKYK